MKWGICVIPEQRIQVSQRAFDQQSEMLLLLKRYPPFAGEDMVEVPPAEPAADIISGYDEETRLQYAGGLSEDTGEESLAE